MFRPLALIAAAALAACSPLHCSACCGGHDVGGYPALADIQVLDRTSGQALPLYRHDGQLRVAGIPGHRYAIRVRNTSPGRILGVVAVDGINAVSGATAGWNQPGYVLSAWESYDVLGWRKSPDRVADFVFTPLENSYAARTGRPQDVGVVGVAIFRERVAPPVSVAPSAPIAGAQGRTDEGATADGAGAPAARQESPNRAVPAPALRLGTGHGPNERSWVGSTTFEPAQDTPDLVLSIRYDRPETLVALGIIAADPAPRPFPQATGGFVADPPARGW